MTSPQALANMSSFKQPKKSKILKKQEEEDLKENSKNESLRNKGKLYNRVDDNDSLDAHIATPLSEKKLNFDYN